ncbi:peroxisome biogenesis factor 2 isoform X2 [Nilaparvata lugens]|uniref:peroxisome biogenesis factor 2 isoform X2 n=1 Tax=Nilaparvata lugens TaxID=108931 RepID=UPI00193D24F1|nr:peroxisome biogenesis factor 2 isoform X2 [Nilaparvata lugens]
MKKAARVTLLDASDLDDETHRVLKDQLSKATKFLPINVLVKWDAEIDALLRLAIWRLKKGLTVMETVICMASFLNLIVFLREGRYPTLIDRILGLEPAVGSSQSRSIGYRYMTRELLWHGFMELITFTLPLVNFRYFKRKLISLIYTDKNSMKSCRFDGSRFELTLKTRCAICQQVPIRPHHISCRHVFCYYCIQSNFCADQNFECPECGQLVNGEIQSCC